MNDGYAYDERIRERDDGRNLLDHFAHRYRHTSRETWLEHLHAGHVTANGAVVGPDHVLHAGDIVVWNRPPWEEPAAPLDIDILHEDPVLLAVCKPSGLPTLPGGGFLQNTLVHRLRMGGVHWSPVHRLGRFTSGIVLCTATRAAGAHLTRQLVERSVYKRYRALVSGCLAEPLELHTPIGPVPYPPLGTLYAASESGRPAHSTVTVVESRGDCTLVDVVIHTGRPHQIRIHLAAAGHPLVGDPLYRDGGLPDPRGSARPGDPGYLLHASEIRFCHPATDHPTTLHAPPPPALTPVTEA